MKSGGICPNCGGNMFHNNACKFGKTVTNASSYEHKKYGNMFKKPNPSIAPAPANSKSTSTKPISKKPGQR